MSETKFHTNTEPQAKLALYILIYKFLTADEKTEGSGLNGSKLYQNFIIYIYIEGQI
jgi:hypothetical protein